MVDLARYTLAASHGAHSIFLFFLYSAGDVATHQTRGPTPSPHRQPAHATSSFAGNYPTPRLGTNALSLRRLGPMTSDLGAGGWPYFSFLSRFCI
jgi:hypothetical protein